MLLMPLGVGKRGSSAKYSLLCEKRQSTLNEILKIKVQHVNVDKLMRAKVIRLRKYILKNMNNSIAELYVHGEYK